MNSKPVIALCIGAVCAGTVGLIFNAWLRGPQIATEASIPGTGKIELKIKALSRARGILSIEVYQARDMRYAIWSREYRLMPDSVEVVLHEGAPMDDNCIFRPLAAGDEFIVKVDYQIDALWPPSAASSSACFGFRILPAGVVQQLENGCAPCP